MNFKNVLIFSDNAFLCKSLVSIIEGYNHESKFEFGVSPFSDCSEFPNGTKVFDMKNKDHVKYLTESYDLILSLHCKQIFPDKLVDTVKCINIHPGFNPVNRGWYPQVFAILDDTVIGATIHEMTDEVDNGPIIARDKVEKFSWDTSETLYNRVLDLELKLLSDYLPKILDNEYATFKGKEESKITWKEDFSKLKEIDLKKNSTYKGVIDHLRALTHGNYDNLYFIDQETGTKVFLKIILSPEVDE